jgi:hypothetical protein
MKKLLTIITSALLCITMLVLSPAQVIASAEGSGKKYISEVKVGMGETSEAASKELLEEGYTIFADDKGNYADLNEGAGTTNALKEGPNQKIVYLGYKTTDDAGDAITDLAVMNMRGGFSYQGYEQVMQDHMDTHIKPFVDRFISTLSEYRENLKKPQDSANYKRADYYRMLLNKLTDDDTGGKPLGDLLLNETKYEMGDEAYNALSEEEKKEHCDILTLLMQGNGQAVMLMETELTKASDSSDNTWLDRFLETDLDKLTQEVKEETPGMTPSEINRELDKKYYDTAKKIRKKWSTFNELLLNYDNAVDSAEEVIDTELESDTNTKVNENSSDEELAKAMDEELDKHNLLLDGGKAAEDIAVHDFLEAIKYDNGTLLDFFQKDVSEFNSEKKIRALYPIVDALSGGQIAGLDFLSIKDMIIMAFTDEKGFNSVDLDKVKPASIFEGVNREIYEKGGVALTDEALRADASASASSTNSGFKLSTLSIVLWSCTAATGAVALGTGIASKMIAKTGERAVTRLGNLQKQLSDLNSKLDYAKSDAYLERFSRSGQDTSVKQLTRQINSLETRDIPKAEEAARKAMQEGAAKSTLCKYLSVGFAVVSALLAGLSIYTTVTEMMEYYRVKFAPIPKYIVEKTDITATDTKTGKEMMIQNQTAYYRYVPCNRTDGSSDVEKKNHEILLDRADLNGDVGQQWLALYSVKYENGMPILADSLKLKLGKGEAPEGYTTGIHMFGDEAVQNLTDVKSGYSYNDPNEGTYVFFKRDTTPVKGLISGSVFSGGSLMLGAILGLIAGVGLTMLITFSSRKRRERKAS